ncbi:RNA polymerase sigma factor [Lachnospiraceae bacterium WCA-693-APC-MOT-I]|uniref:RNA polymerase sigma factor n=2 Tax=Velocimicrobium porci TaxID=2606634 RepID=A0A6L5XZY0_9FIRM|nr:RNA polymerase sigma factor [Velocimicrobium porci]
MEKSSISILFFYTLFFCSKIERKYVSNIDGQISCDMIGGQKNMMALMSVLDTEEEQDKFTYIYENYKYFMWYLANEILQDAHLAEDAVQDSFLVLTRHMNKIEDVKSPKTKKFLATVVKSKAIDILRKRKGKTDESLEENENVISLASEDMLEQYIEHDSYEHLLSCIRRLDDIYKVVFEYKYIHGLSDKEIASVLGVTPKTVNVRIFRARKKLQSMLRKEERKNG